MDESTRLSHFASLKNNEEIPLHEGGQNLPYLDFIGNDKKKNLQQPVPYSPSIAQHRVFFVQ